MALSNKHHSFVADIIEARCFAVFEAINNRADFGSRGSCEVVTSGQSMATWIDIRAWISRTFAEQWK